MERKQTDAGRDREITQILGYLNFSAGTPDSQTLANLNLLFQQASEADDGQAAWRVVGGWLRDSLQRLSAESSAFENSQQASRVLTVVLDHVLPGYLTYHRDLLFHQADADLFNAFFFGRCCEAVLSQDAAAGEPGEVADASIRRLNDFVGYRPVATLETHKSEPYDRERVRPIPLFIRDVGAVCGSYRGVVETALALLADAGDDILRQAHFHPDLLEELAYDPRSYDFDHPVNKRPNYHFGQWDPHLIDNQGRYRRFVVQQVTLDALMSRIDEPGDIPREELAFEAAAVLAGTILMAAGISGSGPDSHDSTVTLATLLPVIAGYRDAFYERLFAKAQGEHAERLRREASERRQPFGGARQHLNARLARRRAAQLEHVQLAKIYARLGYPKAAAKQADVVPTASARIICRIDCRLTAGHHSAERGDIARSVELLEEIIDFSKRGIECGAIIDPWSILGFDAHFSLFPALENSVHDHRADELAALMGQIFALYSRAWSEAAARDDAQLSERISAEFQKTAQWWSQFAAHEVESVDAPDGMQAYQAARRVAQALNIWRPAGAAGGDVAFWASHAEMFDSPEAYALVVDALLQRGDFVTSMAVLVHWLGQADQIPLQQGDSSFHQLVDRWLAALRQQPADESSTLDRWRLARKFFDHLEANAGDFWSIPSFQLAESSPAASGKTGTDEDLEGGDLEGGDLDEGDELFSAAYEDVVFRDSADDGVEGELFDADSGTDSELTDEANRVSDRIELIETVARFWQSAAVCCSHDPAHGDGKAELDAERRQALERWVAQATQYYSELMCLLDQVRDYRIAANGGDHDSMVEYDRARLTKESLLETIMNVCVEMADAKRLLLAALPVGPDDADADPIRAAADLADDERLAVETLGCVLQSDAEGACGKWPELIDAFAKEPLLYVPLAKGGPPRPIVAARVRQRSIRDLLAALPRLGLLYETRQLIETAREMESDNPVGPGAVTEFDDLFAVGCRAIAEQVVHSAQHWPDQEEDESSPNSPLVACLEQITESLLHSWLEHSHTLRLSVLEKVSDRRPWEKLVKFIETYGGDLFTQRFFNLSNVRAILHQGVGCWLDKLAEEDCQEQGAKLLGDLGTEISREEAVVQLSLVLEAIIENYGEYRDYNSTTTQSDRGDMLYSLLDFLRLRMKYDRVSWRFKPVVLMHEALVRNGLAGAAKLWRRALASRIQEEGAAYVQRLARLQKKYAMQLPSVADRIGEKFIRPMVVDRVRALVGPAMEEAKGEGPYPSFEMLEHSAAALTREPTGAGLDIPAWLVSLEDEVDRCQQGGSRCPGRVDLALSIPATQMTFEQICEQFEDSGDWSDEE